MRYRCCNLINSLITGLPPLPPTSDSKFLWYAELPGVFWNMGPTIVINGVPADLILNDPGFKDAMQSQFGLNTSGGWMIFSANTVYIWIYQQADPTAEVEVVFEGNPIDLTWVQGDADLVNGCYEATVTIADTTADNAIRAMGVNGLSLEYGSANITLDVLISNPDSLDSLIKQSHGDSATLEVTDMGGGNILFKILNTIIVPTSITVVNNNSGTPTTEPFTLIACP